MLEVVLTQLAGTAVNFLIPKMAEGAVQAIGSDAYKVALEKLKGFFSYKFAGKQELAQVENNPDGLVSLVTEEASRDTAFKNELEQLVKMLQDLDTNHLNSGTSYTDVGSVADINIDGSVSGSNLAGRDTLTGNNVSGDNNKVGGDYRGSTFR